MAILNKKNIENLIFLKLEFIINHNFFFVDLNTSNHNIGSMLNNTVPQYGFRCNTVVNNISFNFVEYLCVHEFFLPIKKVTRKYVPQNLLWHIVSLLLRITIYAPVNIMATCIIFSGGQIHYEGG